MLDVTHIARCCRLPAERRELVQHSQQMEGLLRLKGEQSPCGSLTAFVKLYNSFIQGDLVVLFVELLQGFKILGWLLVAAVMLSSLLLTCVARCTSPISYLQLRFWRAYATEENNLLDSYTTQHAKQLAERNIKSFFNKTPPENIITPSNNDWEKVSTLYRFSTTDNYYSTLHRAVEDWQEADNGMMRLASVKTQEPSDHTPAVLSFVDEGRIEPEGTEHVERGVHENRERAVACSCTYLCLVAEQQQMWEQRE
ncbi:hypothetical protein FQN60_017360 [Etheostoma spectabile]|uniref:Protein FAM26F n=1 Tax=Etheostoma spectabile TaxID=54343 RepID=A0A5J5DF95_9PERO|nr:hypothetical protein FQN60_017360 [Etheostoma spectabile]